MLRRQRLLHSIFIFIILISNGCTLNNKKQYHLVDFAHISELYLIKTVVNACPMIARKDGVRATGILISNEGYILTDLHVAGIDDDVTVTFFNVLTENPNYIKETISLEGKIITFSDDLEDDLALIKIEQVPPGIKPLTLANDNALDYDQPVWRFGFNNNYRWAYGFYLTRESAQAKYNGRKLILNGGPGASGGPVVNDLGQVVGIVQRGQAGQVEVVLQKNKRKYKYQPPVTLFMPIDKINQFIKQANKDKSLKLGDF